MCRYYSDIRVMKFAILIAVIILMTLLYLIIFWHNQQIKKEIDNFTILTNIEGPLTTYDDYGTFNFILQTDDLPYYDPTYHEMTNKLDQCDKTCEHNKIFCKKCQQTRDIIPTNRFFCTEDNEPIRKELVPANYTDGMHYASNTFNQKNYLLIKKDRPKTSSKPPQPFNYYFG